MSDAVQAPKRKRRARKKKAVPLGLVAVRGFPTRILGRWARMLVLDVAESELTGAGKKRAASRRVAALVADAIPDTPTGTLIELFAVPLARAVFEAAIQNAYDDLKRLGKVL